MAYIGGRQSKKLHNLLKNATIGMLFVVIRPGCPHCDKLKEDGVFKTLENKVDPIDDQPQVVVVDSEAISDPDDPVSAESVFQNIEGVPTIRSRSKNGTVQEYNGPRSVENIIQTLKTLSEENNKVVGEDDAALVLGNNVPLSMTGGRRRRKRKRTVKRRRKHTVKHHRKHKKHTRGRKHHRVRRHTATKHRKHHRRTSRAARTYRRY